MCFRPSLAVAKPSPNRFFFVKQSAPRSRNDPFVVQELEEMLLSILHTYGDRKSNKQICFCIYTYSIKAIQSRNNGKGVRKFLNDFNIRSMNCVRTRSTLVSFLAKVRNNCSKTNYSAIPHLPHQRN